MQQPRKTTQKRAQAKPAQDSAEVTIEPAKAPSGEGSPAAERTADVVRDTSRTARAAAASQFGAPYRTGNRMAAPREVR